MTQDQLKKKMLLLEVNGDYISGSKNEKDRKRKLDGLYLQLARSIIFG